MGESTAAGKREATFSVYMLLIAAIGRHWWITSYEARAEEVPGDVRNGYQLAAWKVADAIRTVDDLPEARAVLQALFSFGYATEDERHRELERVTDQIGNRVNPQYAKAMSEIGTANDLLMSKDFEEWWRRRNRLMP